ncbi:pimeloyl-ACP methyl ester carboxylesterase [Actinoplanes octamycinicus]|uniref:Pimeloyl-ACP methyl ester carboxylesterase n=1 Tax=Actinoplanes octamycinicus TaxID=135948 RepID=A0A7W7GS60_9ACTN|nr:alpha/beta fold hydrolase [Actinoplanes octamycinicus]MBB4737309.1 pimeloyl-ACP methyl ester carboxylesterase [Actinoplanes octamycinicus]GIE60410.1 lipase [Actinoplanes octamycinicus]
METGPLPVHYSRREALRHSAADPRGLPPGARRPEPGADPATVPVILVHGTNGRSASDWFTLAPLLANEGRTVYPFDWRRARPGAEVSATHRHAEELAAFITSTGATRVDVVGHSWGAVLAHYLVRCLPGEPAAGAVRSLVGLAPTYGGTTLHGLLRRPHRLPGRLRHWLDAKIPTWREQLPGSAVLRAIQAAPPAPGTRFTTIVTRYDQMVTPYTASLTALPGATPIVLQQHARRAVVGHLGILHHPVALTQVVRALDPA